LVKREIGFSKIRSSDAKRRKRKTDKNKKRRRGRKCEISSALALKNSVV
jgi:hypothetical protein